MRDLKKYLAGDWVGSEEEITPGMAMGEFCMLGLRTREGIGEGEFRRLFGRSLRETFPSEIRRWTGRGWLAGDAGGLRLTPEGILFADEVAQSFLP